MSHFDHDTLGELLFSLIPADGAGIGNQALLQKFAADARELHDLAIDDARFEHLKDRLLSQGRIAKGMGPVDCPSRCIR